MKKLTAGIFAGILTIVTVNAAHADIATTNYVNQNVDNKVGLLTGLATTAQTNAVAAINEVKESVDTVAGNMVKNVADVTEGNKNSTTMYPSMAVAQDIADKVTSGKLVDINSAIDNLEGDIDKVDVKVEGVKGKIGTVADGKTVVELIDEAKNAASTGLTDKLGDLGTGNNTVADALAKKADKTDLEATDKKVSANETAINDITKANGTIDNKINAATTTITTAYKAYADQAKTDAVTSANQNTSGLLGTGVTTTNTVTQQFATTNANVKTNTDAITKLNGADTVEGSVDYKIKNAIDAVNTTTTDLTGKVNKNTADIATLNGTGDGSVTKAVNDAKDELTTEINKKANAADVYTTTQIDDKVIAINSAVALKASQADLTATNTKVTANENAITKINTDLSGKVDIKKDLAGKVLTTDATTGQLKDAAPAKPTDCNDAGVTCMLINDGKEFKWEKIVDTYTAK